MQWLHKQDSTLIQNVDNAGLTVMHQAAQRGDLDIMQWLFEQDPTLIQKADRDGWSAMHFTALHGRINAMRWLHEKDPKLIISKTNLDVTPLKIAWGENKIKLIEWMRSVGVVE